MLRLVIDTLSVSASVSVSVSFGDKGLGVSSESGGSNGDRIAAMDCCERILTI